MASAPLPEQARVLELELRAQAQRLQHQSAGPTAPGHLQNPGLHSGTSIHPGDDRTHPESVLGQHIQRRDRDQQGVQLAPAHAVEEGGAFDQVVTGGGEQPALGVPPT